MKHVVFHFLMMREYFTLWNCFKNASRITQLFKNVLTFISSSKNRRLSSGRHTHHHKSVPDWVEDHCAGWRSFIMTHYIEACKAFVVTQNYVFPPPTIHIQWGKKVFSQPPIVQVLPLKKMKEACNFHHRYTSTMRDKIRKKNPENHIVGFFKNLFANYGGK